MRKRSSLPRWRREHSAAAAAPTLDLWVRDFPLSPSLPCPRSTASPCGGHRRLRYLHRARAPGFSRCPDLKTGTKITSLVKSKAKRTATTMKCEKFWRQVADITKVTVEGANKAAVRKEMAADASTLDTWLLFRTPRRASEPEAASRATRCGLCRKPRVRTLPWARARKRLLFRDAKMASCGTCEQPARFHDSVSRWRASSERGQERAARPGLSQCFERWSRHGWGADLRSCTLRLGLSHRPKPLSPRSLEDSDSPQDAGNSHPLLSSS
ncbi:hypothetical protein HPB47_001362 [Ixodes persulcatus]|uniref:Uncharacterized protein n=1 Tax=Ixodes persulcatus TaxID=34615 RepID=A0AC60PPK4_IXOPE|nr:hypothetical protein HPB47_001362 [Ixodes persulcatus]